VIQVHANPRPFPHGGLTSSGLAVLMIDMQRDFLDPEGYLAAMGYELDGVRSAILPARRLLELARGAGLTVIHTRQGFRPDLGELAPHARARVRRGLQRLAKLGRSVAS
jgi:nicotinamidase-related amidase